jgi:inner membrane protein
MVGQIFDLTWAWIIGGAIVAGLEILLPGAYLLWIGLGAIVVGLVLSVAPELPLAWQAMVFAASMLLCLGVGVWLQNRRRTAEPASTLNRETASMIGQRYMAITPFVHGRGRIRVQDTSFAAVSEDAIAEGEMVVVTAFVDGRAVVARVAGA